MPTMVKGAGRLVRCNSLLRAGIVSLATGMACSSQSNPNEYRSHSELLEPAAALSRSPERQPAVTRHTSYAKGRWRLVPRSDLANVVLWVSHILIRHREAEPAITPLSNGDWLALPPVPNRDRMEALEIAEHVAKQAQGVPGDFARLARQYSEDPETSKRGGAIGGIPAVEWALLQPEALDALAALKVGKASEVVETQFGFHVFLRRPVPELKQLSARRIVIGHDRARFLKFAQNDKATGRSREEALAIAQRIVQEAREAPARFPDLVSKYSEHRDIKQGGDIGSWSNREPSPFSRELEVVAALPVGGVSEPIDSQFGYQIFQRTPVRKRERYAIRAIRLAFDLGAPVDSPMSKQRIQQEAIELISTIRGDSRAWARVQEKYGGGWIETWTRGRGPNGVTEVVKGLKFGRLCQDPIESDRSFIIAERLDPTAVPPSQEPRFELPDPVSSQLLNWLREASSSTLLDLVKRIQLEASASLELSAHELHAYQAIHEELSVALQSVHAKERRMQVLDDAWIRLSEAIDERSLRLYLEALKLAAESKGLTALAPRGRHP